MQFERRLATVDGALFDALDALLDGPFAICSIITGEAGDPVDSRFLRVSRCFEDSTGFRQVEGRTMREVMPGVEQKWIAHYARAALQRVPTHFEEDSEVTGRRYEVRAAPVAPDGCFVVHFRDLTKLERAEREREAALAHAQHLLKELGHRVMNSFAAISAILAMEARAASAESRGPLDRVQGRVQALAALYRRLDGASQVDRVDVADYLGGNVRSFRDSLATPAVIEVTCEMAPLTLPTRSAVPLGLVLNELLTNALKHAFAPGGRGSIHVTLSEAEGLCRLCVADDGGGMTPDVGTGIGRALIAAFVGELGGEFATETGPGGTRATVTFRAEAP